MKSTNPLLNQRKVPIKILKNRVFILILIGFLTMLLAWSMPRAVMATFWQEAQEATPQPAEVLPPDATLEVDFSSNREQTNGVIMGGILLVLIVVGGTLIVIRRSE